MAIYSASTKSISRKQGRSATAAIAYRAGEEITDERTGQKHDYTKKQGVLHTKIITPDNSQISRSDLWNMAEKSEKRKDARVAREWLVALPHELNQQDRNQLAERFAHSLVQRYGCAADIAIHTPDKEGDNRNYHAHILLTTRKLEHGQLTHKTHAEWSDKKRRAEGMERMSEEIKAVRSTWETIANQTLERAGLSERIDHRSHKDLYDDGRLPTIKMGQAATELERQGIRTERGDINRDIKAHNRSIIEQYELIQQLKQAQKQLQDEQKRPSERFNQKTGVELPQSTQKPLETAKNSLKKPKLSELTIEDKRQKLNSFQKMIVETAKKIHAKELQDIREQAKPMLEDINKHRDNKPLNPFKIKAWQQTLDKKLSDYNKLKTQHDTSKASGYGDEHKQKAYAHAYLVNPAQYELAEKWQEEIKEYDKDQAMQNVMQGVQRHRELQQQNKDKEMDLDF